MIYNMIIMKIDLSKLSFWKSVLLVVLSATILFAAVGFLTFRAINIILTPPQSLSTITEGVSGFIESEPITQMFLFAIIFTSIISVVSSVFFWWVAIVAADYSAVKIFKLKSNYEHLIPASAVIYSVMSVIILVSILVSLEMVTSNILWRIAVMAISWLLYMTAIKDIYEVGWKKAFLIPFLGALIIAGITILGYLVGVGIGLVIGLVI